MFAADDRGGIVHRSSPLGAPSHSLEADCVSAVYPSLAALCPVARPLDVRKRTVAMSEPTTPPKLDQFEIIRRLGVGGMAEVFLAKKRGAEGTYKLLVVKRILPSHVTSRRFKAMFAEEAQLATRLNHPNIVQVYDFQDYGPEGQILTMEYVEGPDLRKLARAARAHNRRIPPYAAACIIGEVAKGLHYAHERRDEAGKPMDIVHRDVSPQNVLLSYDGAVKIADFGIASANLFREEPGVLKGKTGYMSPEQARGEKVDRHTDIYSLGVVFHELLTGRPLHGAAEGAELFEAVRAGVVEPPSTFAREIPPALESIVMKALERQPSDRFATARDMAAAISRALLQQQQLVDMHVLESVIAEFVNREHTSPGVRPGPGTASSAEGSNDSRSSLGREPTSHVDQQDLSEASLLFRRRLRERAGREVRHVAVVTVRIHGLEQLDEAAGAGNAGHFVEQLGGGPGLRARQALGHRTCRDRADGGSSSFRIRRSLARRGHPRGHPGCGRGYAGPSSGKRRDGARHCHRPQGSRGASRPTHPQGRRPGARRHPGQSSACVEHVGGRGPVPPRSSRLRVGRRAHPGARGGRRAQSAAADASAFAASSTHARRASEGDGACIERFRRTQRRARRPARRLPSRGQSGSRHGQRTDRRASRLR